jgi:hypothetical protein
MGPIYFWYKTLSRAHPLGMRALHSKQPFRIFFIGVSSVSCRAGKQLTLQL